MPRSIVVIQGHPDRSDDRLCRALAHAYAEAARQGGHEVQEIDVAALDFPLLSSRGAFEKGDMPESLRRAWEAISNADHLAFFFPLWLGMMPALLKGFLEQVMRPGFAFRYGENGGLPHKALKGKTARLVVTMGMPAIIYRLWYRSHGLAALRIGILNFVGISPVRETLIGMVEGRSEAKRAKWFDRMRELGRRGI